jgi:hypothetical protein
MEKAAGAHISVHCVNVGAPVQELVDEAELSAHRRIVEGGAVVLRWAKGLLGSKGLGPGGDKRPVCACMSDVSVCSASACYACACVCVRGRARALRAHARACVCIRLRV